MSRPAIVVENLSKKFRIGTGGGPGYHRLSEMLTGLPRFAYNKFFPQRTPASGSPRLAAGRGAGGETQSSDFWALKNVSFEVQPGEVVGIIGRNGAGKSTLLKILSRITEPTSGRFGVRGRVASLLEVGTGFHPELTGRENIYVSGITLGMTRAEIKKRFDEIVDFSGVERFLDTPVKHYSSGMQVRLGFAVAAHLNSEILIIDEVLAVGDAEFQRRCQQRISDVSTSGRTVLLVTHHLETATSLCNVMLRLENGRIADYGAALSVCSRYAQKQVEPSGSTDLKGVVNRQGSMCVRLESSRLQDEFGTPVDTVSCVKPFRIVLKLNAQRPSEIELSIGVDDTLNRRIAHFSTSMTNACPVMVRAGSSQIVLHVDALPLRPGDYSLTFFLMADGQISDWVRDGATITVRHHDFFGTGILPTDRQGSLLIRHHFSTLDC